MFIMNYIYKINKYKILLMIINDQTLMYINFFFDFLLHDSKNNNELLLNFTLIKNYVYLTF